MPAPTPHPLARWRALHGMTQHDLAAASGVPRITVSRAELGNDPRVSTALALAHALGVAIEDIWTRDGEPSSRLLAAERRARRR